MKKYTDIFTDSREVTKGSIFIALSGDKFDGNLFVQEAVRNGAACIISQQDLSIENLEVIKVSDVKCALAELAAVYYPFQPKNIMSVTGTNGKTSVVNISQNILENLAIEACSIGTLGVKGALEMESSLTTPDLLSMRKILNILATSNINYAAIEASSHGLELGRLLGLNIQVGVFTNFTRDHLDFHGTFDNYFKAKMLLFTKVIKQGVAVLNADIEEFTTIKDICQLHGHEIISYGKNEMADFRIVSIKFGITTQSFIFIHNGHEYELETNLLGEFQVYNILSAIIAVWSMTSMDLQSVVEAASDLKPVVGRMELVWQQDGKLIFVDYSHTPDSLEKSLEHARKMTNNKLHLVFGCGGDRDKGKRPLMGAVAQKLADEIIITDDNPRNESPQQIAYEIQASCPKGRVISGRSQAIEVAILSMEAGDVLLIAGKGHEKYQIINNQVIEFDDCKEVLKHC